MPRRSSGAWRAPSLRPSSRRCGWSRCWTPRRRPPLSLGTRSWWPTRRMPSSWRCGSCSERLSLRRPARRTSRPAILRIPLHKTAQGGGRELTARQLRCACGVRSRPMCPAHAAMRHVSRLKVAGFWRRGGPLFPDAAGATWAKGETVMLFRRVLLAAGVTLTTVDHEGHLVQLFAGHAARVAGAAWLASKGVPTAIIQLLGRWSSTAVERYVQAAPLAVAPEIPGSCRAAALARRPPPRPGERPRAAWRPASQLRNGRGRRRCRPRLGSRWITLRRCNWSRPRRGVRGPGWATTRRRGRTSSTMRRGRRCTAPTRRRPALSRSSGGLGAARGRTASGASSGCLRSRRPQPGAPVVSRHRPVETVKVHRPSRWTPRWRPARRLSLPGGPESAQNGDAGPHCDGPAGVRGPRRPAFLGGGRDRRHSLPGARGGAFGRPGDHAPHVGRGEEAVGYPHRSPGARGRAGPVGSAPWRGGAGPSRRQAT